jgi:hypothetical protein
MKKGITSAVRRVPRVLAAAAVGLTLLLAHCGGDGHDGAGSPAATVAYIVTACRQTGASMTLQQEVRILRGAEEAATVVSVGPFGPFRGQGCAERGDARGSFYPSLGPLQRFGITPDGSGIVYELNDVFVSQGRGLLPPEERGIYYIRTDGSEARRLGPASRSPTIFIFTDVTIAFSPDGQEFAYIDRGPDEAGHDAAQVFVHDLMPGEPRQVTRLPSLFPGRFPENGWPLFIDTDEILFGRFPDSEWPPRAGQGGLVVDLQGNVLSEISKVVLPDGRVIPIFRIIGADWLASRIVGEVEESNEVAVSDGTNVLQLTNFGRSDTVNFSPFYSPRDQRVYFTASADPFGTNPTENCQIFSIDPMGRDLRQLTFFRENAAHAATGCLGGPRGQGCRIDFNWALGQRSQDPQTGAIFFRSSCDPLGQNPNGGQLFSMQPDGSGLRQLSNAPGAVRAADGTVEVETVDTFWSAPYR